MVGTRTWGGVIGIDSRYRLVDGTPVTQPKYAMWLEGFGWGVENHGVDPDVEVVHTPADWAAGRDPQLDRAIGLALAALEATPAKAAPPLPELELAARGFAYPARESVPGARGAHVRAGSAPGARESVRGTGRPCATPDAQYPRRPRVPGRKRYDASGTCP